MIRARIEYSSDSLFYRIAVRDVWSEWTGIDKIARLETVDGLFICFSQNFIDQMPVDQVFRVYPVELEVVDKCC